MRPTFIALLALGLSAALAAPVSAQPSRNSRPKAQVAAKAKPARKAASKPPAKKAAPAKPKAAATAKKAPSTRAKPTKQAARRPVKGRNRAPAAPKGYSTMVQGWHEKPDFVAPLTEEGRAMLVLECVNTRRRIELRPERDDGGFSASELERAARFLADRRTGAVFPVDPRLLDLVYRIRQNFDAPLIRVISAFRAPSPGSGSKHGHGRAIDIVVPGTSDEDVAGFARGFGFVGVGTYPTSGFVHIDTRPRSYFWVDRSGPGKRRRTQGVLGNLAAASDAEALARGEKPPLPFAAPHSDCQIAERAWHDYISPTGDEADDEDDSESQFPSL